MSRVPPTLARIPLFRTLDEAALRQLDSRCTWRDVAAKQLIVDQEGQGTDVFFVLNGHLRVFVTLGGHETILRDIHEGDFFGEMAALDRRVRSAGIVAIADSTLASMPANDFRKAIHTHPEVCDQILAALIGQVRMLANRVNESNGLSTKQRLWAELLRLSFPSRTPPGLPVISPPPTHADLASRVGSQRETVTRELNTLERAGLIARRRGAIELRNPEQLRHMVLSATEQ